MILQLQANVHGLGNLRVLSCTYPIFNEFKETFWIFPSSRLGRSAPRFVGWLFGWLVGWLVGWFVGWLVGWLLD